MAYTIGAGHILAASHYVGEGANYLSPVMTGKGVLPNRRSLIESPEFLIFPTGAGSHPRRSHAIWFMTQMVRWGQIVSPTNILQVAEDAYLTDVYRKAAGAVGIEVPDSETLKNDAVAASEVMFPRDGANLVDGRTFNPRDPVRYMEGFARHNMRIHPDQAMVDKNNG